MTSIEAPLRPPLSGSASRRTWTRPPLEAGAVEAGHAQRRGRRSRPRPGRAGARRRRPAASRRACCRPSVTTTSAPVTRSTSCAYSSAPTAESVSTPAVPPWASSRRVRAGASASPRPVSKRPAFCSAMTPRRMPLSLASWSSRAWIGPRCPAWIACGELLVLRDHARGLLRLVLLLAEQAGRGASAPRRAARRSCPARSRTRARSPTAATTIIGRMTRTMKKTVSRLRKLIRAPGDRPA